MSLFALVLLPSRGRLIEFFPSASGFGLRQFSTRRRAMRFNHKILLRLSLHLALTSIASATTWYVNGVSGSDIQLCKSPTAAFRTIGHALSIASSGDAIMVAAATYTENLTISDWCATDSCTSVYAQETGLKFTSGNRSTRWQRSYGQRLLLRLETATYRGNSR